jgi:molecular chaperone HtpG
VKDVRVSARLTDSAVCLVAGEGDMDMYLERLLRQHRRLEPGVVTPRILEINPAHPVIRGMAAHAAAGAGEAGLADAAWLLLDQARIVEGEALSDPAAFARRLSAVMAQGLAAAGSGAAGSGATGSSEGGSDAAGPSAAAPTDPAPAV